MFQQLIQFFFYYAVDQGFHLNPSASQDVHSTGKALVVLEGERAPYGDFPGNNREELDGCWFSVCADDDIRPMIPAPIIVTVRRF